MKTFALALGGSLLLLPGVAMAQEACTNIVATGHPEYWPVGHQEGDAIVGVGATLVTEVATQLGIPIEVRAMGTWAEAQIATREGTADVIFGLYYNDDRAEYLTFVQPPFMVDPAVVVVRAGDGFAFAGWDDLIGKHGVTNTGESYGEAFDTFIEESLTVDRADGTEAVFTALLEGRADYAIIGFYPGIAEADELGIRSQIEVLSPTLLAGDFYVAFSQASPCAAMAEAFGAGVAAMVASGHIADLLAAATAEIGVTPPTP